MDLFLKSDKELQLPSLDIKDPSPIQLFPRLLAPNQLSIGNRLNSSESDQTG